MPPLRIAQCTFPLSPSPGCSSVHTCHGPYLARTSCDTDNVTRLYRILIYSLIGKSKGFSTDTKSFPLFLHLILVSDKEVALRRFPVGVGSVDTIYTHLVRVDPKEEVETVQIFVDTLEGQFVRMSQGQVFLSRQKQSQLDVLFPISHLRVLFQRSTRVAVLLGPVYFDQEQTLGLSGPTLPSVDMDKSTRLCVRL